MASNLDDLDIDIEKWSTNRLIIERTIEQDFDVLAPMLLDKDNTEYIDLFPIQFHSVDDSKEYLKKEVGKENLMFTIRLKTTNAIIGQIGYYVYDGNMSIFYWIGTEYQNKGYAPEAAISLSNYVFQKSHLQTFAIYFHLAHIAATKSAAKVKDGLLKEHPEWTSIYKERGVQQYIVSNIDDENVTITRTNPDPSNNSPESVNSKQRKCLCPDELLSIGTKFELRCGFYIISKNKNPENAQSS